MYALDGVPGQMGLDSLHLNALTLKPTLSMDLETIKDTGFDDCVQEVYHECDIL